MSDVPSPGTHVELDRTLRNVTVPAPHTWHQHDVATTDVRATLTAARAWADHVLPRPG